ncbi:uncharacterized protein PV09_07292 [Verruconis gallopava]|uniref:PHD-type domain-containing protein n=1 Tax=Verruconis gallopava TaxID=253628 RepID=A0A0D2A452_9PEZI|nr:uncharacterized protein PV09_07292 [Verruconis gallopava]KIW01250.1 hypothetical protein PV09_07292 [Verruconis gallopava]
MSFKLSSLLNPAPSPSPISQPSHIGSSQPWNVSTPHDPNPPPEPPLLSSTSQSPSPSPSHAHISGHGEYDGAWKSAHAQAQATSSSHHAASATGTVPDCATDHSSAPMRPQQSKSPTLPAIVGLPKPTGPAATRRESYTALPPWLPDGAVNTTLPLPANGIEQHDGFWASSSPGEQRRQSLPALHALVGAGHVVGAEANRQASGEGTTAPIRLAPLRDRRRFGAHNSTGHSEPTSAPPQGRDANAFLAPSSSSSLSFSSSTSLHDKFETPFDSSQPHPRHHRPSSPTLSSLLPRSPTGATRVLHEMSGQAEGEAIEQSAPDQIREPDVAGTDAKMTHQAPEPETTIKDELAGASMDGTPVKERRASTHGESEPLDEDTLKAIEAAKNDFGLRAGRPKAQPSIEEPLSSTTSPAPPHADGDAKSKKRPAPKVKKGQATVKKPPAKKRKVDDASSTTGRRSLSPGRAVKSTAQRSASGKKSTSNTPALGSSPAPGSVISQDESAAYASDGGSSSEGNENEVFCICRKGDNHTWMIACDGGCEDWFHGKCVNILEDDGELIDKYICPNCEEKLGKVTTWLPACRNRGCRRPARIRGRDMSKYCSDKCGREFMQGELKRSEAERRRRAAKEGNSPRNRRMKVLLDDTENSDDDLGPRGSSLKASELKALVESTSGDVAAFRSLGAGVLSPPATVSPTTERFPTTLATTPADLNASEKARIEAISAEKDELRRRRALLKDREKFGQMIRENVARYAEQEKIKPKDVCGYDSRLTWGEEEFSMWRESEEGAAALESGTLPLPEPKDKPVETNGVDKMDVDDPPAAPSATMCTKRRCERHRLWQKQALADVRFEESTLADQMRALEAEEREIRDAAALRGRMEAGGMNGEGIVEVVGP